MLNKIMLVILVSFLGIYAACAWTTANEEFAAASLPVVEHSAAHNRLVNVLHTLDTTDAHCPAFLDAPLGNKPCPAQDLLDITKAHIQAQIDSTY